MASFLYHSTSKEEMITGFPPQVAGNTGDPPRRELLRVFRHMIECAQLQMTNYCILNWLFLVVPANTWTIYPSTSPYPDPPGFPGDALSYNNGGRNTQNATIRDQWQLNNKNWVEDLNMNKVLTERFLALIPHEHRTTYKVSLIRDPNRRFGVTFQHFYDQFGVKDELELERNRDEMKTIWSLSEGLNY